MLSVTTLLLAVVTQCFAQQAGSETTSAAPAHPANYGMLKTAHAVLAILAWVVFFPLGGVIIRLLSRPRTWLVHALWQMFSFGMFTAAVALGIVMVYNSENEMNDYHPVIGLLIFALVTLEPIGGYIHHVFYKQRRRNEVIAQTHIWIGRILITLGMINGGLGLLYSSDGSRADYIAYGVVAGVIWVAYVAFVTMWHVKTPDKDQAMLEKQAEI